jgi:hypothetical protein
LGRPNLGATTCLTVGFAKDLVEHEVKHFLGVSMALGIAEPLPFADVTIPTVLMQTDAGTHERTLHPIIGLQAARMQYNVPADLDDMEAQRPDFPRLRTLQAAMTGRSHRAAELRNAASLFCDAVAAVDPGMAIALSFFAMEAVLLEPGEILETHARLKEAIVYRLGTSGENRSELRKKIKKFYIARSKFVHTGNVGNDTEPQKVLDLAKDILKREIIDLEYDD